MWEDTINSIKWGEMPKRKQELQKGEESVSFLKGKNVLLKIVRKINSLKVFEKLLH